MSAKTKAERVRALRELAVRGVGGERDNARRILAAMERDGLIDDNVSDERINVIADDIFDGFVYGREVWGDELWTQAFNNIVSMVMGQRR